MKNIVYSNNLEDCHTMIKQLRKDKKELNEKCDRKIAESTYWKNKYEDRCRRIEYLEKHCTKLQQIVDTGNKQSSTFNKNLSGIYRIYNKTTGESYVGQSSINVDKRCASHFKLCNDINDWHYDLTHNPDDYDYEIIIRGVADQRSLDRLEVYYIGKYDCFDNGYNNAINGRFAFIRPYLGKI